MRQKDVLLDCVVNGGRDRRKRWRCPGASPQSGLELLPRCAGIISPWK
jgi:hypothetical protein